MDPRHVPDETSELTFFDSRLLSNRESGYESVETGNNGMDANPTHQTHVMTTAAISRDSGHRQSQVQQSRSQAQANNDALRSHIPSPASCMVENNGAVVEQTLSTPWTCQDCMPVMETCWVAQESSDSMTDDRDVHPSDSEVQAANQFLFGLNIEGDLSILHYLCKLERITLPSRCLLCLQQKVTIQNLPCGCCCSCRRCADLTLECAQCRRGIQSYRRLRPER
uniref:RING-type domain-containing protein n=1 Tax=Biomphalaria glabrata TaxID=6526 RepID=A0A2C9L0W4_BIOGL